MKKSSAFISIIFLILILTSACSNDDESGDGKSGEKDLCEDVTCIENATCVDGGCVCKIGCEGDPDLECVCGGRCTNNDSRCVEGDLQICENRNWKDYECRAVCNHINRVSLGCGETIVNNKTAPYCLCRAEDTDGDTDYDNLDCYGPCNPEEDGAQCIGEGVDLCACDPDINTWVYFNCDDVCARLKPDSLWGVCDYSEDQGRFLCSCSYTPEGDCRRNEDCPPVHPYCIVFEADENDPSSYRAGTYCSQCLTDEDCDQGVCLLEVTAQDEPSNICTSRETW